jgi:ribosome-associated translation inhibitor RaiA
MSRESEIPKVLDVEVTTHGEFPGAGDHARDKIGRLGRYTHQPVLSARVKLTRLADPAVPRPVVAQGNLDVNGRLVRAQVAGATAQEAIDRLEARLRRRLERVAEHWEARRGSMPSMAPHEWRHQSEPTRRQDHFPRPEAERQIIRHKACALGAGTVDEAAFDMDMLDYDFHLFTELGTGQDSVLYRGGPTGYRLALPTPPSIDELAAFELPLTVSTQPAPRLTTEEAISRLGLIDLPFLYFVEAATGRSSVLYHRYDGHYGLITRAG